VFVLVETTSHQAGCCEIRCLQWLMHDVPSICWKDGSFIYKIFVSVWLLLRERFCCWFLVTNKLARLGVGWFVWIYCLLLSQMQEINVESKRMLRGRTVNNVLVVVYIRCTARCKCNRKNMLAQCWHVRRLCGHPLHIPDPELWPFGLKVGTPVVTPGLGSIPTNFDFFYAF